MRVTLTVPGGLWSLLTSLAVSTLRDELSSLSFLFRPQANTLAITKSGLDQAVKELDKSLAAVFMGVKVKCEGCEKAFRKLFKFRKATAAPVSRSPQGCWTASSDWGWSGCLCCRGLSSLPAICWV